MAKGQDPFEKFKQATLSGTPSIKDAIAPHTKEEKAEKVDTPSPTPSSQPVSSDRPSDKLEQVSFFINRDLKRKVGLLKYETGAAFKELYEEAITDLLKKYHKL